MLNSLWKDLIRPVLLAVCLVAPALAVVIMFS